MHGFQSSSCCVELGDRRVLQSEVENEQCLLRLGILSEGMTAAANHGIMYSACGHMTSRLKHFIKQITVFRSSYITWDTTCVVSTATEDPADAAVKSRASKLSGVFFGGRLAVT